MALPLTQYTSLSPAEVRDLVEFKLSLVGLAGKGGRYPSELSGGMRKRAGLARALALDPEVLFFDEPSAGLDPLSSRRLDELILALRESLGATVVIVTHELDSIDAIADTVARARHYAEMARDALAPMKPGEHKDALLEVLEFCINRAN